jgi:hypothetical protein
VSACLNSVKNWYNCRDNDNPYLIIERATKIPSSLKSDSNENDKKEDHNENCREHIIN